MGLSQLQKIRNMRNGAIREFTNPDDARKFKAMVYRVGRRAKSCRQFDGSVKIQVLDKVVQK